MLLMILILSSCQHATQKDVLLSAAQRAKSEKKYDAALNLYSQVLHNNPNDFDALMDAGDVCLALGQAGESIGFFERAASLDTEFHAKQKLGKAYLLTYKSKEAQTTFQSILKNQPNDKDALNGLAVSYDQQGDHKAAQKQYHQILQQDPNDILIKSNLGLSLAFSGDYDRSLALLEPIGLADWATKQQRHNLALAYTVANKRDKAQSLLDADKIL
ncbi:MAG: tetratricopeptide repeat protein [Alphaproteobacteria bacterium]|nr:tetratricopeptide repeat protein [Alphaproteobacteria bacterium]